MAAARRTAAALAALVVAALCLQHASAQAATGSAFDGLWRLTLGPQIGTVAVIGTSPGRYVLVTGASSSAPPRQQVASQYAIAFARDGNPDIIDVFSVFGNFTVQLPANSLATGAVAAVLRYDNLTAPFANLTRLDGKVPFTAPSFDGYFTAADGSRQTCLRSLHANGAYACVRNRALANGTVVSTWALLVQRKTQLWVADAFTNTGDQTYTLSAPSRATLAVATVPVNGSRATPVASLTRKALPLERSAPPLAGVFRSNPSAQFMVCGTPASARAAALCVGSSSLPGRPMVVFNVVEVQQPSGLTTEQLTSLGFFTSRWSDAAGTAKLQFFPGVPQVVAVGYRTTDIRTLVNTWTINGVPVQCEGTFLATNCIGARNANGTVSTVSMIASGNGFGIYNVDYVMTTGSKVASYKGPLTVSVDGLTFTPALPAAA